MNKMKAGRYYIGDLCYLFEDDYDIWDKMCSIAFNDNESLVFEMPKRLLHSMLQEVIPRIQRQPLSHTQIMKLNESYSKDIDKIQFAMVPTKWGDGYYEDQYGKGYSVDSGTIGCIHESDFIALFGVRLNEEAISSLGNIVSFENDFTVSNYYGVLHFGHIIIDTVGDMNDGGYYEEDYD